MEQRCLPKPGRWYRGTTDPKNMPVGFPKDGVVCSSCRMGQYHLGLMWRDIGEDSCWELQWVRMSKAGPRKIIWHTIIGSMPIELAEKEAFFILNGIAKYNRVVMEK